MIFPITRLRRLRYNSALRNMLSETTLSLDDLILPLFIREGEGENHPIASMPGQYQITLENLEKEIKEIVALGLKAVFLFGIPLHKDTMGSASYDHHGIIPEAIRLIKKTAPELLVISDICFCEYTDHGHCGIIKNNAIDNDTTLEGLKKQVIAHAQAGVDIVAPSGMMDGAVAAIRHALDEYDYFHMPILSYSVKYASALYGPFREAAGGAPQFGDRKSHQMNPANSSEALREAEQDIVEGADMLMVKPASHYLDIIYRLKEKFSSVPLAAYHVSGEYSMIKAAAANGWIDETNVMMETTLAIKRAGADLIITYFAKAIAKHLK